MVAKAFAPIKDDGASRRVLGEREVVALVLRERISKGSRAARGSMGEQNWQTEPILRGCKWRIVTAGAEGCQACLHPDPDCG